MRCEVCGQKAARNAEALERQRDPKWREVKGIWLGGSTDGPDVSQDGTICPMCGHAVADKQINALKKRHDRELAIEARRAKKKGHSDTHQLLEHQTSSQVVDIRDSRGQNTATIETPETSAVLGATEGEDQQIMDQIMEQMGRMAQLTAAELAVLEQQLVAAGQLAAAPATRNLDLLSRIAGDGGYITMVRSRIAEVRQEEDAVASLLAKMGPAVAPAPEVKLPDVMAPEVMAPVGAAQVPSAPGGAFAPPTSAPQAFAPPMPAAPVVPVAAQPYAPFPNAAPTNGESFAPPWETAPTAPASPDALPVSFPPVPMNGVAFGSAPGPALTPGTPEARRAERVAKQAQMKEVRETKRAQTKEVRDARLAAKNEIRDAKVAARKAQLEERKASRSGGAPTPAMPSMTGMPQMTPSGIPSGNMVPPSWGPDTAPTPKKGSPALAIIVVVLILAAGGIGFKVMGGGSDEGGEASKTTGKTVPGGTFGWEAVTGGFVAGTPTVVDNVAYAGSYDGSIYAFDVSNGTLLWSTAIANQVGDVTVVDGVAYVGTQSPDFSTGELVAIDVVTHERLWAFTSPGGFVSKPTVTADTVVIADFNTAAPRVVGINRAEGTLKWEIPTGGVALASSAENGVVFAGGFDKNVYAIDIAAGTLLWTVPVGGEIFKSPTVSNGVVYTGANDGKIYALDAATGTQKWAFATTAPIASEIAISGTEAYFGNNNGEVVALRIEEGHLGKLWTIKVPTANIVAVKPLVIGDKVVLGGFDGVIYGLSKNDGSVAWTYQTGAQIRSSAVTAGDFVIVGSDDNKLYAIHG